MKAYSPGNSEVCRVYENSKQEFFGIAYDSLTDKLYWSADFRNGPCTVSRANRNGTALERVVHMPKCECLLV